MKTSKMKAFAALFVCVMMILTLCACQMDTKMNVKPEFVGERVMSFEVKGSDLVALSGSALAYVTADDITAVLSKNCPDVLKMDTATSGTLAKTTTYTFTLAFSDFNDYKAKIGRLLGRTPNITYVPEGDEIFWSGISLKEDFASQDLFDWAIDALSAEYPRADINSLIDDVKDGETVLNYNGKNYVSSSAMLNVKPEITPLEFVEVETMCYGQTEYSRTVSITISTENLNAIGKDELTNLFLAPLSADIAELVEFAGWNDENTYVIKMKRGGAQELAAFTSAVFEGSTVTYEKGEASAFAEYGTIKENINFSGFICNEDKSANVLMTYKAVGSTKFLASNGVVLSGEDKFATISDSSCTTKSFSINSKSNYTLAGVTVAVSSEIDGDTTVGITLAFPSDNSKSAAEHVYAYLSEQYANVDVKTMINAASRVDPISGKNVESYGVVIIADGTPEEISEALRGAFGSENNQLAVNSEEAFELLNETEVVHTVDISSLVDEAEYSGPIIYVFEHAFATIQDASSEDNSGNSTPDILGGEDKNSSFTTMLYDGLFTVSYKYVQLNFVYLIVVVAGTILAFTLLIAIVSSVGRRAYKNRQKKNKLNGEEAVRSVAIAMLPEEEQKKIKKSQIVVPAELENRPVAVIEPRFDEGLDDENDEPEGIIMFSSAVRLLAVAAIVLFFFPFYTVSNNLNFADSISGWNLFYGKSLFGTIITDGVQLEGIPMVIILLVIPVVILLGLTARRFLPRLVFPIAMSAAAVFEIVYLLQLPEIVGAAIDHLSSATSYIAAPVSQMAYDYTIVINVLIALSGVLLLFADVAQLISRSVDPSKKK